MERPLVTVFFSLVSIKILKDFGAKIRTFVGKIEIMKSSDENNSKISTVKMRLTLSVPHILQIFTPTAQS